ncbi:MAG: tripartite tricarboxylate transporter substrate binding protein, partial [Pseudolabrys sp.]|nr:tripartite tricarboxylate transporter substrate binding protein [Pseudolabrys sp.]
MPNLVTRRAVLGGAAALAAVSLSNARAQDAWPSRLVRVIVPYPAGG